MEKIKHISIAKDFSRLPSGRFEVDSNYSAERFKKEILLPALKEYEIIVIDFDGIAGISSCFLEETFGGIIRDKVLSVEEFNKKIVLKARQGMIDEINSYIITYI